MKISSITWNSVVDGPGLRNVVWFHGCPYTCEGCHNQQLQIPNSSFETDQWFQYKRAMKEQGGNCIWRAMSPHAVVDKLERLSSSGALNRMTLSGGEPLDQMWKMRSNGQMVYDDSLLQMVLLFKQMCKNHRLKPNIWLYSGNLFEVLVGEREGKPQHYSLVDDAKWFQKNQDLLRECDVLVEGPFVKKLVQHDPQLPYGSSNQRCVDLKKTFKSGKKVLWRK